MVSRSKSIHFYATKRDLEAILSAVESQRPLKYTEAGMCDAPQMNTFTSGLQIPNLGFAPSGEHGLEPFWLITGADAKVELEAVPQRRGGMRYGINPEQYPESVFMWPGGVFDGRAKWPGGAFEGRAVIAGRIGTGMVNPASMELLNLFAREIRRRFKLIKSYYVGPDAEQLLDRGYRLTPGVRSAKESDLSKE